MIDAAGPGVVFRGVLAARAAVRRHRRRQHVHAAIAARADWDHAAIMAGDVWRGTFGALRASAVVGTLQASRRGDQWASRGLSLRCGCCR